MHTPLGHTNHFWVSIGKAIIVRMNGCVWQVQLASIELEVATKINKVQTNIKLCESSVQPKEVKTRLGWVRCQFNKTSDPREKAALSSQEETIIEEMHDILSGTMLGDYNPIYAGIKEFLELLKARPKKNSK